MFYVLVNDIVAVTACSVTLSEDTCIWGKFWKTSYLEKMLPINWLYSLNIDTVPPLPPSDCVNYIHENTFISLLFHLLLLLEHHLIHLSFPTSCFVEAVKFGRFWIVSQT